MVTTALAPDARPRLAEAAVAANDDLPSGLTSDEARRRLHFQPFLLRGGVDRPRAPRDSAQRRVAGCAARRQGALARPLSLDREFRETPARERDAHRQILPPSLKEEQRKRFLARIDEPEKNWKFSTADIAERKFWKQYMKAYEKSSSRSEILNALAPKRSDRGQGQGEDHV
jgi:hypothetical protein